MVFDRVLPRPAALYDETNTRIHGPSSLLDHKIMKDPVAKASSQRPESESCSSGLAQMQLSSLNRERFTQNHGAESSPHLDNSLGKRDKTSPPSSGREQSPIPSPIKSAPPRTDSGVPFCLCQPDPKIPRPRNGRFLFPVIVSGVVIADHASAFILFRQHYQASVWLRIQGWPILRFLRLSANSGGRCRTTLKSSGKHLLRYSLRPPNQRTSETDFPPGRESPTSTAVPRLSVSTAESGPRWVSAPRKWHRRKWQPERIVYLQPLRWTSDEPSFNTKYTHLGAVVKPIVPC